MSPCWLIGHERQVFAARIRGWIWSRHGYGLSTGSLDVSANLSASGGTKLTPGEHGEGVGAQQTRIVLPNVVLMLGLRLRRWPNIKTTLGKRSVFAGRSLLHLGRAHYKVWCTLGAMDLDPCLDLLSGQRPRLRPDNKCRMLCLLGGGGGGLIVNEPSTWIWHGCCVGWVSPLPLSPSTTLLINPVRHYWTFLIWPPPALDSVRIQPVVGTGSMAHVTPHYRQGQGYPAIFTGGCTLDGLYTPAHRTLGCGTGYLKLNQDLSFTFIVAHIYRI